MKRYLPLLLALALPFPAHADRIGNGGGGPYNEDTGEYKTFHGAGFLVEPAYLTDKQLPDLVKLRAEVKKLGLAPAVLASFQAQMVPTYDRKFFNVLASKFSRDDYEKIKQEYIKVFGDDRINVAIYAITDTEAKITYLLPEFYQLNELDRLSILFHETLWMYRPNATYKDILRVDDYMHRYLSTHERDSQFQLIATLDRFVSPARGEDDDEGGFWDEDRNQGDRSLSLPGFALGQDLQRGSLKGWLGADGSISVGKFLGPAAFKCYQGEDSGTNDCDKLAKSYWLELAEKYPQSLLLQALLGSKFQLSVHKGEYDYSNMIRYLSMKGGETLSLTQKDLYTGQIAVSMVARFASQKCQRDIFGKNHCEDTTDSRRVRFTLVSFLGRAYVTNRDLGNER